MKRVLCVRFPNWPVQRLTTSRRPETPTAVALHTPHTPPVDEPQSRSSAFAQDLRYVRALFPAARTAPAIVAVSPDAWSLGVRPGLPLAEARNMAAPRSRRSDRRALDESVGFYEWQPHDDRCRLTELAEPLRRFAPVIGLDDMPLPDSLLLDVTGCGALFGGESVLAEELIRVLRAESLTARVSITDSVAASWAFTHADGHSVRLREIQRRRDRGETEFSRLPILIVPPGEHLNYAAPLPLAAARLPPSDITILNELGLITIAQVLGLPRDDLPSRLSEEAVHRIRCLRGLDEEVITPIPEADPVRAQWASEFPLTSRSQLAEVAGQLTDRITAELLRRRVGCVCLLCELTDQQQRSVRITAEVIRPLQSRGPLLEVLQLRLDALQFAEPIAGVCLQAVTAPLPAARQKDLFSATEHLVPQDELATLVNRLSGRLGRDAVLAAGTRPDPRPEHAVELSPVLSPDAGIDASEARLRDLVRPAEPGSSLTERPPVRPLRLMPVPLPLSLTMTEDTLVGASFQHEQRTHRIRHAAGPERLQTAWWTDHPARRDYFRITTDTNSRLWIYRELNSSAWYLHGIFD